MKHVIWLVISLVILCQGCQSSNSSDGLTPGDASLGDIVENANFERQTPSDNSQAAGINGTLNFSGFTVLDAAGQPLTGVNRYTGIQARLVDPEDDILSSVVPDTQGRFTLTYTGPLTNLRLEVQLTVRDDLNGDGRGTELLRQMVPVYLASGYTASANWVIRKGLSVDFDQRLLPSKGMTLVSQLGLLDSAGQKSQFYATVFATDLAVMDLDGDRFFELGEDLSGADVNHDGWIDEAQIAPGTPDVVMVSQVIGVVVSVDMAQQQLLVRQTNGVEVLITVPPFAGIEILDKVSDTFLGPIPLDASLIQSTVVVQGLPTPAGMDATWVVVYR